MVTGTFFDTGKVMAAKGGERVLLFTCCAQETGGFLPPIDPRLHEIFIFYASLHDLATIE